MKKRLIALFAATAVAAGTLCLAGCAKDSEPAASETYTGTVSTQTYASENEAAAAFVATELSGPDYQVELKRYEKSATLTESEVTDLDITSKVGGTIQSVEKGKIYFGEVSSASAQAAADGETDLYVTVYLIKYTPTGSTVSTYTYMIPLPANNEVLTASYFNSVMNPESYKNCTVTSTTTMTMSLAGQTQSETQTVTMQITETAVKMSMKIPADQYGTTMTDATVYIVDSATGVKCCMEAMGECMVVDADYIGLDIDSISEIYENDMSEIQYSLYVKTDYGFKMRDIAVSELVDTTLGAIIGGMGVEYTTDRATADFKVVDGKMYKSTADIAVTATFQGQTMKAASKVVVTYTNFGSTTVTISDTAKAELGLN